MQANKLNLRFAHDKYSQLEMDILFELVRVAPAGVYWMPVMLIMLKRLLDSGLLSRDTLAFVLDQVEWTKARSHCMSLTKAVSSSTNSASPSYDRAFLGVFRFFVLGFVRMLRRAFRHPLHSALEAPPCVGL